MFGGGLIGSLVALWLGSPRQRRLALGAAPCICLLVLSPLTIAWRIIVRWLSLVTQRRPVSYANAALAVMVPLAVANAFQDRPAFGVFRPHF
jgi:hypothetical protein